MLTDADRELITAAVDGGLPPDREAVLRALLANSADAAALFARLQSDSRRLKALPVRPAPANLARAVAEKVAALPRAIPVAPRSPASSTPDRAGWLPYAVAAAVLLAVSATSFWYSLRQDAGEADRVVQMQRLPHPDAVVGRVARSPAVPEESPPEPIPAPRYSAKPENIGPELAVLPPPAEVGPEPAPLPRVSGLGEAFGSRPLLDPKPFESVKARLPVLVPVADLGREEVRIRVLAELGRDPAFRLDLFVRDLPRAVTAFQAAAHAAGVAVTAEASTLDRLRKKQPIAVAVYTEALSAEDVVRLLGQLAALSKSGDHGGAFLSAHLVPATAAEQREVRELLGVDPGPWKRPAAGGPKSVTTGTAGEVAAALKKEKGAKPAILLTYLPVALRASPAAKEVRAFLDRRGERKSTAVPLLVVIRPAS
jgi:hypothetical protein